MNRRDKSSTGSDPLAFLVGGGEMGSLIRSMDWSKSLLGPVAGWPQSLRTTVSICLASDLPICVIWGPGLVQLYNDAYRVICGDKHPRSMGQNFPDCWKEAWPVIGEAHDSALAGDTAFLETQQIFLERHGYLEECFFTFSFSPIRDEAGQVGGLFHPVIEMTTKMLGERRTRALRDLAARTSKAKSVSEALALSAQTLAEYDLDLPFVLLYAVDSNGQMARLVGTTGLEGGTPASPDTVDMRASGRAVWPLAEAVRSGSVVQVDDVAQRLGLPPYGTYPEPSNQALVLPILPPGSDSSAVVLVAGVSPRLPLNEAYRSFYDLVASGVTAAVANARAYEEERRRAEALAVLDRAKTAFFSNVSHEFRTPLTLMLGPVEDMLARSHTDLSPAAASQLEVVNRNGLRLLRLVNTMLDFSRIEAGRVRAMYQPTDLAAFTAELASVFRAACERAGLRLEVDCPPLSEPVYVDRDMWEKVVLNLLSNAFKFTFDGEIAVVLRQEGDAVELRVRDTGTGVPVDEMPRLFERFHRVENAGGRTHEGSGIGLALVQELIKLHGGTINAESVVGNGTTFTVSVPLGSAHLPPEQIGQGRTLAAAGTGAMPYVEEALRWLPDDLQDESEPRSRLPKYHDPLPTPYLQAEHANGDERPRVLVADDNADMRQYVVRLLAEHYRIEAVPDGQAALAAARNRPPDLILTDVMMPRLDGFGLLRELRADPRTKGLPVIMLSARAGEESRVEGMEAGADDYLVKPFSARELLARVAAHLQMARMRREASESLRQSGDRLRMALTAARMVAWQFEPSTEKLVLSDNADDVLGLPAGTTLEHGEEGLAILHPDDVEAHRAKVMKAVEECGSYFSQYRIVRQDNGLVQWMEERGHGVRNTADQAVRLVGVVLDVTERKRAEQVIKDSEARFRSMADTAPTMLWVTDPSGSCTYLSKQWFEFTGGTPEEDLGFGWLEKVHPDDRQENRDIFLKASEQHTPFSLDHRLRRRDGEYRWVVDAGSPRFDEAGEFQGFVGAVTDVHDRRQAEEAVWQSEVQYRLIVEGNPALICRFRQDGTLTFVNDTYCRTFGKTREELVGHHFTPLIPDEDQPTVARMLATLTPDMQSYTEEHRVVVAGGEVRWQRWTNTPVVNTDGQFFEYQAVGIDITDRRGVEERLAEAHRALKEADRRKDEFLATLAHELRNPLAPLRNGLQLMKLARGNGDTVEQARTLMERQLVHMVRLVDDLLDVSRISRGQVELKKERVQLAAVVQSAVETSRPLIDQMGHDLTLAVPPDPIYVDGDVTRLAQVLSNLLNNAAKYTERGGHISLSVERQEGDAVIAVVDSGVGIPAHMLPQVFELFTQVDRSLERSQGGLGIGLSLVQRLVELHGGSVEARSDGHGRGSTFIVRLPVVLALVGNGHGQGQDVAEPVRPTARRRILVVDDNRDSAKSLAMLLTIMGNETLTAHDGLEALDVAAAFRPDVMLLDIGLPKLNGYEVCRRIRQEAWGKDVVSIALTGWGQEEDKRRSLAAGLDFHLVKPVDPAVLEKLLTGLTAARA